jgi:hypothetical protein
VDADPILTQDLVRNNYIIYRPANSDYVIRTRPVEWEGTSEFTQFPVYSILLFANQFAGEGAIHTFRLRAFPVGCPETVPSLRIVDGTGAEVYRIESTGRVIAVRQGNPGFAGDNPAVGTGPFAPTIPPTINGVPMDFVPPGSTVVTGTGPVEVTVSRELATLSAEFWQDIDSDGLFESGPVGVVVDAVRKNPDATFTYTLSTPALQKSGVPGVTISTMFVIKLNVREDSSGFNLLQPARYQAQTQDMHGNLLCDFRNLEGDIGLAICTNCSLFYGSVVPGGPNDIHGCYLSTLTGVSNQYVYVLPYFFQYDPPPVGNPPPPPPPGPPPTVADVEIKPEVFHCNTGVFTAFISFKDDERFNGAGAEVDTCNCNGANAFKIINDAGEHHYTICKFNRNEIIYNMGTNFVCTGTTTTGIEWSGMDEIERIVEDCE